MSQDSRQERAKPVESMTGREMVDDLRGRPLPERLAAAEVLMRHGAEPRAVRRKLDIPARQFKTLERCMRLGGSMLS